MIIQFTDTEKNVTYLKVAEGHTQASITDMCNEHYKKTENRTDIDPLTVIEYAIRKQLMILMTDEEVEQLQEKQALAALKH